MKESLKQFIEKAQQDGELKTKLLALSEEFKDAPQNEETKQKVIAAVLPLAEENGFTLKAEDFDTNEGEISDLELAAVAGGGGCGCALVGGGGGVDDYDYNDYGCACVGYGQGGDGRADDFNCFCPGCGQGNDISAF